MKTDSKKELFETMPVPRAIASMAIPTIISQLINLIYNLVDTFFIGRTGNSYMVAAVTVAFPIFMMTISFANLYGVGGGSLVARLSGEKRFEEAKKVSAYSFYGAIVIAAAYSVLIALLMEPILNLLGASKETIGFARQYVWLVVVAGDIPMILSNTIANLLRNTGYSRQASIGLSGGGILNMILDPLFMFVLLPDGWEVFGAALATLISNVAALCFLASVMAKKTKVTTLSMRLKDAHTTTPPLRKALYAVGIPSAVLTGLFDLANIVLNALMSVYGDLQLAAIGIVMKAERLPNAVNIGICQGVLPIIAYNYAAGNRKRMNSIIRTARLYGLIVSALSIVLYELFTTPIAHVFLSTSGENAQNALATIGFAVIFLRIRCTASPVQFINYHTSFCMQAVGDGKGTLLHAFLRELVFYIPFMLLLNRLFGMYGLVCALIAGEACGAAFALILFRSWQKRHTGAAET